MPSYIAQGLRQGKYHVLLASIQFGSHLPAPLAQLLNDALDQNFRRRGTRGHPYRLHPIEPLTAQIFRPIDQIAGLIALSAISRSRFELELDFDPTTTKTSQRPMRSLTAS